MSANQKSTFVHLKLCILMSDHFDTHNWFSYFYSFPGQNQTVIFLSALTEQCDCPMFIIVYIMVSPP